MAKGPKGRGARRAKDRPELVRARAEPGEAPELPFERGPEESGVVGREGDANSRADELAHGMPRSGGDGSGRRVRRETDVERHAAAHEEPDGGRVLGGAEAVRHADGAERLYGFDDRVGPGPLAGVDERREGERADAAVDRPELPRRNGRLVPSEAEPDDPRPRMPLVEVEDAVRRVGAPVPDGVEEDGDASVPAPLVRGEDGLERRGDIPPRETDPLDDRRRDVDLGVPDPLASEPARQVAGDGGVVLGAAEEPADVAVEREELLRARDGPAARHDGGAVGEEAGSAVAVRQADERLGRDRALEVEMELGLRRVSESVEETRDGADAHGTASYRAPSETPGRPGVPWREIRWLRTAALGIDLAVFAGLPLLLSAAAVFGALLFVPEPPDALALLFRAAQLFFAVGFLVKDAGGASPGKRVVGLRVVGPDGEEPGLWSSAVRNLPLLVPGWNLFEAWSVFRRPERPRSGDRAAGTVLLPP